MHPITRLKLIVVATAGALAVSVTVLAWTITANAQSLPGPSLPGPLDRDGIRPPASGDSSGKREQGGTRRGATTGPSAKAPKPVPKVMRRPGASAVPDGGSQRAMLLRELYAHLATAADETVAQRTTNAIEHVWKASVGDTVGLLMSRAAKAAGENNPTFALELMEHAVKLAPDNAEVFFRRGMLHYTNESLRSAVGDLRRVLALDPNHYKALEGLGQIFKETKRTKAALAVFRRLREVHPQHTGAKSAVEELTREVEGQPS